MNHEIIDTIRLLRSTRHVDLKQEYLNKMEFLLYSNTV